MSSKSITKRVSRSRLAWVGAAAAAAAAVVGVTLWATKSKAATGPIQKPIWAPVAPQANGSIVVPVGTFALSMLPSNPNYAQVVTDLGGLVSAGTVNPTQDMFPAPSGTTPTDWPTQDNGGSAAVRFSGTAPAPFTIPAPEAQAVSVWTLTGFTA